MAYSFLTLAKDVLEKENIPLSVEEMWDSAKKHGLLEQLSSSGKTPIRTLSARIYVDIKNNEASIFEQVSKRPAKFFLKGRIVGLKEYEEKQKQEKELGTLTSKSRRNINSAKGIYIFCFPAL